MKRALDDGEEEEQQKREELEEGEEYEEEGYPVAGPSTFVLPPPPPPPPLLRLVVHHSSQNPSANLLPPHQTLALIQETTTIGRDKAYEPRIRLKTLEVSRTHATIFQQQQEEKDTYQDGARTAEASTSSARQWYIVDNASTHGTYIRRAGEEQYTRLSEKGQSSLPRQLNHTDTIKLANQRFIVHLHETGDVICEACAVNEDRSNLIPLLEELGASKGTVDTATMSMSTGHIPMHEREAKTFTKEEKKQNFRSNMQSLRKNLLTGGSSVNSPRSSKASTNSSANSEDESNTSTAAALDTQPRYVDRAKLRRSIHPPQHGLSDADPPQSKRSRLSPPPTQQRPPPSYGPGAALFQKMLQRDDRAATAKSGTSWNESSSSKKEVQMGKVIEVRTMTERTAGLGSGSIREGVEQHAGPVHWQDAAKQRRWREANR